MLALFVSPDVRSATFAFTIVAVFDSPVDNLKAHVKRHKALSQFWRTKAMCISENMASNSLCGVW